MTLKAIALNCSLKRSGAEASSTDAMIALLAQKLAGHAVELAEVVRVADLDIKPGVTSDEGPGDDWPGLRRRILAADILILGTPIWLGQMSSIAKRVLERMDAFLGEADDKGRMPSYGKVAVVAVVGNEDGAHGVSAHLYQALNDTGWSIAASGVAYWVGEAMAAIDFKQLGPVPDRIANAAGLAAANAAHLAQLLQASPYPGQ